MAFRKGISGNPGGRPRIPDELKKSCRRLALIGMKGLEEIITRRVIGEDGKPGAYVAKDADRIAATKLAMEYGFGRPVQPIGGDGEGGAITVQIVQFADDPEE